MDDSLLLKIALLGSLLGIGILFAISVLVELPETKINELETDKLVVVNARISQIRGTEKVTFMDLSSECKVTGIVFDQVNVDVGDYVRVKGSVQDRKGKKEIIVEQITLLED